jgi:hypothetical protein
MLAYSLNQPRTATGRFASGGSGGGARAARAVASFKPSTQAKQEEGDRSQKLVARALGGQETGDNEPMDVVLKVGSVTVGVEAKTFCDQTNDKVTVHPESRARKEAWAKKHRARTFVVVVDRRDTFGDGAHSGAYSGTRYHVAEGIGSFRLGGGSFRSFDSLAGVREYMGVR